MIAKRIHRVKGGSHFGRLARYVIDARGGLDPTSWKRTADYILDTEQGGAKVGGVRITNCLSEDPAAATLEILACQARNTRAQSDKTYHLVISFPPGERPALERLHYIEDELCKAIGFTDHQRISAVHTDTEHLHVHVAISKVHPQTLHCIEPYYDHPKLMQACARLEMELGLTRTHQGEALQVDHDGWRIATGLRGRSEAMEAHAGRESLISWIRARCGGSLRAASSWQGLHTILGEYALEARLRGAGMVFGAAAHSPFVKASDVHASLSLSQCTKRWGPFEPCADAPSVNKARYGGEPKQDRISSRLLWEAYQRERSQTLAARQAGRERLRRAHNTYAQSLAQWYQHEVKRIRARAHLSRAQRRAAYKALSGRRRADFQSRRELEARQRREISSAHSLPTWQGFLERRALGGDTAALQLLQQRARSRPCGVADELRGPTKAMSGRPPSGLRKHGDALYKLSDGGLVIARPEAIRVEKRSELALSLALELASDQFKQPLVVDGSEAFQAGLARAAGEQSFDVRFSSSALEAVRKATRGLESAAASTEMDAYIHARNKLRQRRPDAGILHHRPWTVRDTGEAFYEGRRAFGDGTQALLLRRGEKMVLLKVNKSRASAPSRWRIGDPVVVNLQGQVERLAPRGRRR